MQSRILSGALLLVGMLAGRPVAGQAPAAATKARGPVGTWVIDRDGWIGRKSAFLETATFRSDSTVLFSRIRGNPPARDTVVSTSKQRWGRMSGDSIIWIGPDKGHPYDTLVVRGRKLIHLANQGQWKNTYTRTDAPIVFANRYHPRPAAAPTGLLAQLVGTWAMDRTADVSPIFRTIRADSTVVVSNIMLNEPDHDTISVTRYLQTVTVAGDTLWWGARSGEGWKAVVQDEQLSLLRWNPRDEQDEGPGEVYKKVSSSTEP